MTISQENKRFLKTLLYLGIPIMGQEFLNNLVNTLDVFMLGFLGDEPVTAVGLANQVFFMFSILVFGINSGASAFMGQFWGKQDTKSFRKVMGLGMIGSLIAALFFAFVAFVFPEKIMSFYSYNPEVIRQGASYLRIVGFAYILTAMTMSISFALKSTGETKIPMVITFCAVAINGLFNYIFIFVFDMGIVGAAWGTVIARSGELILQLIISKKLKLPIIGPLPQYFTADKAFVKKFLIIVSPVAINDFIWSLGTTMYNIAYKECGTTAQAAVQIATSLQMLVMVLGIGLGLAAGIMLSNKLGADEKDLAISYSRKCVVLAGVFGVITCLFLVIFSPMIVGSFKVSPEVKAQATKIMYVIAVGIIFKIMNYTNIVGILRSGGDTKFCMWLEMATVWLIGVPFSFLGAKYLGLAIYWVVAMVYGEELIKSVFSTLRVFSNIWAKSLVKNET